MELVNISSRTLDLAGWTVSDRVRVRFTFPNGTVLPPGAAVVVFGGGAPAGDFGGSLIFTAGSLGLNNSGDRVVIHDAGGVLKTQYQYGAEGGDDQSLTQSPDLIGPPLIKHQQAEPVDETLFSPGVRTDGQNFSAGVDSG